MTLRVLLRPLMVASLAVLFGLFLAHGAGTAHAQLLPEEDPAVPEVEEPEAPAPEEEEEADLIGQLLEVLDPEGVLDLENLSLDELLSLLDLLAEDTPPPPAVEPAPVAQVPAPTPAPAPPPRAQVVQRPVGGVATGAGGATDNGGTTLPLLAFGALTLAGTAAMVRPRGSDA